MPDKTKQNIDHNNVKSKKYIFSPKKYATYWFYLMSSKDYNNDIELSITLEKFLTTDKEKTCTEKSYNILDSATDKNITVKKIEFKCGGIYKFMMEFKERKAGYAIMMVAKKLKTTEYP